GVLSFHLILMCIAPAPTQTYTLPLHDALPILFEPDDGLAARGEAEMTRLDDAGVDRADGNLVQVLALRRQEAVGRARLGRCGRGDRKSTRLNSSHVKISYAVFCLKKKNTDQET